ncbi:hypothetical protein Tsp_15857 [Trichinella spiralis]|uniref:hypothetical protein n=1 Tax=Trichinella spiralis TaxID=6334 RepID=UPI0001EFD4CF|nr:hypothetical protein Tsp_15857 [Trichinella spiralis]
MTMMERFSRRVLFHAKLNIPFSSRWKYRVFRSHLWHSAFVSFYCSPSQKQFIICISFCAQGWYFGFAPGNPSRSGAQKYSQKASDPLRMPFLRQQSRRTLPCAAQNI